MEADKAQGRTIRKLMGRGAGEVTKNYSRKVKWFLLFPTITETFKPIANKTCFLYSYSVSLFC